MKELQSVLVDYFAARKKYFDLKERKEQEYLDSKERSEFRLQFDRLLKVAKRLGLRCDLLSTRPHRDDPFGNRTISQVMDAYGEELFSPANIDGRPS